MFQCYLSLSVQEIGGGEIQKTVAATISGVYGKNSDILANGDRTVIGTVYRVAAMRYNSRLYFINVTIKKNYCAGGTSRKSKKRSRVRNQEAGMALITKSTSKTHCGARSKGRLEMTYIDTAGLGNKSKIATA